MIVDIFFKHPYWAVALVSFFINIPFGYIRENHPKFSFKWFLWIHASIPAIVYLRIVLHTSRLFIPVAIFMAIAGQIFGSRYRWKIMTYAELERLEQIPDLRIPRKIDSTVNDAQIGVVLLNMGGPENPAQVRPFLKRLFLDSRIIRIPFSTVLQPLFAALIVSLRGKKAERRYGLIGGGSPILQATLNQVQALAHELTKRGHNIFVTLCFNYSRPLVDEAIAQLKKERKNYILPLSLYPHYSAATTGSSLFYLQEEVKREFPQAIFLPQKSYFLDDGYIAAFVERINEQLKADESLDDFYLLFSAHGLPLYYLREGDPYPFQIAQTVSKIVGQLGRKDRWAISYQSAVGPFEWLKPSTDSILKALAQRGEKKLLVVPVSFVTDHIETLCEIDIEYRALAEKLGISDFRMSKALECHPAFIKALADCIEASLEKFLP